MIECFTHYISNVAAFFMLHKKGGKVGYEVPPLGFSRLRANTGLFLGESLTVVMARVDFGVLLKDSFVCLDASINLEKEGNERFPRRTRDHRPYSEWIHRLRLLHRLDHNSPVLSRETF